VSNKGLAKELTLYFFVIAEITLPLIGGFFIGTYLDDYLDTYPALTIVFFVGGIAVGVKNLILLLKKLNKEEQ
jgi:ATP synthase protein I